MIFVGLEKPGYFANKTDFFLSVGHFIIKMSFGQPCNTIVWSGTKSNTLICTVCALGHGTKYCTMVYPGTNYDTIAPSSTKCDSMFWGGLPFVRISLPNVTISWHGSTVTISLSPIPNADTSAKCNIVVYYNTCCTKCNNNDWSCPINGAKCDLIVVTVLLLWSYPR